MSARLSSLKVVLFVCFNKQIPHLNTPLCQKHSICQYYLDKLAKSQVKRTTGHQLLFF